MWLCAWWRAFERGEPKGSFAIVPPSGRFVRRLNNYVTTKTQTGSIDMYSISWNVSQCVCYGSLLEITSRSEIPFAMCDNCVHWSHKKRSSLLKTTCIYKDFNAVTYAWCLCTYRTVNALLALGPNCECVDGTSTKLWLRRLCGQCLHKTWDWKSISRYLNVCANMQQKTSSTLWFQSRMLSHNAKNVRG